MGEYITIEMIMTLILPVVAAAGLFYSRNQMKRS